jgi:diaminopimelate decarboxylase
MSGEVFNKKVLERFSEMKTPFYYYDLSVLDKTLAQASEASKKYGFEVHYALKANVQPLILKRVLKSGFGADCVSGNEVKLALESGFPKAKIVFAGVGKSDDEIRFALSKDIFCFNCESKQELEVIQELAKETGKKARIALRINPNVNANTHKYITTGLEENKFGINLWELEDVVKQVKASDMLELIGIHFHIGSQITDLQPFRTLCTRVNEIQEWFVSHRITLQHINVGGGLGINYHEPDKEAVPDFETFFKVFSEFLVVRPGQQIHFELGRAFVGQCGNLISRVLYIKNGINTNFAILDAGMTELIRPALYQSFHKIENLTAYRLPSTADLTRYDVVGPICESSDCFGKAVMLPETKRGDLIAIRSAGAYGEVMASRYNSRDDVKSFFSGD